MASRRRVPEGVTSRDTHGIKELERLFVDSDFIQGSYNYGDLSLSLSPFHAVSSSHSLALFGVFGLWLWLWLADWLSDIHLF